MRILVVGGGAFGIPAATELARRGHDVQVIDRGSLPRPEASSTDISKAVRADYGGDVFYAELAERATEGWRRWNREHGEPLFHADGFLVVARERMRPESFEGQCHAMLSGRDARLDRVDGAEIRRRFPAWRTPNYDGYLNLDSGWAESGRTMAWLVGKAREAGVRIDPSRGVARVLSRGSRVAGVETTDGATVEAELVLVAAGAWTPWLLPHLADRMSPVGQPVLHFRPEDPRPFAAEHFPVWAADIAETGWYGFPLSPDGVVKVGHHGRGQEVGPGQPLEVAPGQEERFRSFLRETFHGLGDAPLAGSRLCLYCDTFDGDFWIDHDPDREGLVVAAGGSGHGFKFAPLLGSIVADVVEKRSSEVAGRFAWRAVGERRTEHARFDG